MKFEEMFCECGVRAKDEKYAGEFIDQKYHCVDCVRKLNAEAVRKSQELQRD